MNYQNLSMDNGGVVHRKGICNFSVHISYRYLFKCQEDYTTFLHMINRVNENRGIKFCQFWSKPKKKSIKFSRYTKNSWKLLCYKYTNMKYLVYIYIHSVNKITSVYGNPRLYFFLFLDFRTNLFIYRYSYIIVIVLSLELLLRTMDLCRKYTKLNKNIYNVVFLFIININFLKSSRIV